jgi:hypothetical protein
MPWPNPNYPRSAAAVRQVVPFQISAARPVNAMQNDVLGQDTVFVPPPGCLSSRSLVPFHTVQLVSRGVSIGAADSVFRDGLVIPCWELRRLGRVGDLGPHRS